MLSYLQEKIRSMLTMYGFSNIQFSNPEYAAQGCAAVIARKPAFKAGGTSLKNRKKNTAAASATEADANPWANLGNADTGDADTNQINEDSLMADDTAVKAVTE